jgi:hypothetical protein
MPDLVVAPTTDLMLQDTPQDPFVVPTARVLLILVAFAGRRPDGLTVPEIARIDFLLRHPPLLARAVARTGRSLEPKLSPTDSERLISEQVALRVRYGPWDERYQLVVGRLLALQLAQSSKDLSHIGAASAGHQVAGQLRAAGWERIARHAEAAARALNKVDVTRTVQHLAAA